MSLYDVLKVPKRATRAEIEKSYRTLARSHHPNRSRSNPGHFTEVNQAYTILRDRYKRDFYDMFGSVSIQLLLHNRDSYILTRMFDRPNIYLYLVAFMIDLGTLLALPFLVASRARCDIKYTSMVSPFGVAGTMMMVPLVRSLLALHGVYGVGPELRSVIFGTCELLIMTMHAFNCAAYFDGFVTGLLASTAVFLFLECVSLISSLHYQRGHEKLISVGGRDMFMGKLIRFAVFILMVSSIPPFAKPLLCLAQVVWISRDRRRPAILTMCILIPPVLYTSTFSLVLAGFSNLLIYVPLVLLALMVVANLCYALFAVVRNTPKSQYDEGKMLPLPYYGEVV